MFETMFKTYILRGPLGPPAPWHGAMATGRGSIPRTEVGQNGPAVIDRGRQGSQEQQPAFKMND